MPEKPKKGHRGYSSPLPIIRLYTPQHRFPAGTAKWIFPRSFPLSLLRLIWTSEKRAVRRDREDMPGKSGHESGDLPTHTGKCLVYVLLGDSHQPPWARLQTSLGSGAPAPVMVLCSA